MKKIMLVFLVLVMMTGTFSFAFASDNEYNIIKSSIIYNLDNDSKNLKNDILDNNKNITEVTIEDINLTNTELQVNGFSKSVGKNFEINGKAKSIENNYNVIPFEATDDSGNFEVVYISAEKDIANSSLYHKGFYKNNRHLDRVLKIYLKEKNTDNLLITEVFNPNSKWLNKVFNNRETLEVNNQLQFWYVKLFNPEKSVQESDQDLFANNDTDSNKTTHRYKYNHLGGEIYHNIEVSRLIQWPSELNGQADFYTELRVLDEETYSYDFPNDNNDESCFELDDVRIDIAVDEGDALKEFELDGLVHNNFDVDVDFGFNTSVSLWGPVSIDLSYSETDKSYDLNDKVTHLPNGIDGYYRQQGVILESGKKLTNPGHYFSCRWNINNYTDEIRDNQEFKVKFSYYLYNELDYTDSDDKTLTETKYYTSN